MNYLVDVKILDSISHAHHVTRLTLSQYPTMSHFFFSTISAPTLSDKNNVKILLHVRPHLSCSLLELIYHSVYCRAHSCLFMLRQCKRQSGEVPRTVFVCHRVPFLIPQAPAMPGGVVCVWGRELVQRTPSSFFPSPGVGRRRRGRGMGCEEACLIP